MGQYNSNYIVIGGTATVLNLEEANLQARATKDIDMIVVCEALSDDYVRSFWKMIQDGGYKLWETKDDEKVCFYRFVNPTDVTFPSYIELFSRVPDLIKVPEGAHLVHIPTSEYLSSLSAIIMDDDYYRYAVENSKELQGIRILDIPALIVLKAKAYINNLQRKEDGQKIHQDDIDKHKKDIYRLSYLLSGEERFVIPEKIKSDMEIFIKRIQENPISTKALANAMRQNELSMEEFCELLRRAYQI